MKSFFYFQEKGDFMAAPQRMIIKGLYLFILYIYLGECFHTVTANDCNY